MNGNGYGGAADKDAYSARLHDLYRTADKRYSAAVGDFCTPREFFVLSGILKDEFSGEDVKRAVFYGGYDGADRKKLFILPDYLLPGADTYEEDTRQLFSEEISLLLIEGSGYETLSHRDYMGALLGLGIKRSVLGDIICCGDSLAYALTDAKMADFISQNLSSVGRDRVKIKVLPLYPTPCELESAVRTEKVTFTAASMRADGVLSALTSISRERAKSIIASGLFEVNYVPVLKPDAELHEGDIISARGFGKYIIGQCTSATRRGRLRVLAEKYI
ncbi:MAG: YlmH/Sll1252 family protein [Firmicutes bacterium]|nr:YlmH/Sll1252 family protein [Bacillota bacterium]